MLKCLFSMFALAMVLGVNAQVDWSADQYPQRWISYSRERIEKMLNRRLNGNVAKNVIMFLGDG